MKDIEYAEIMLQTDKQKRDAMVDELSEADAKELLKKVLFAMQRMSDGHQA